MEEEHQNPDNPIYGDFKNTQSREEETANQQRDLSSSYYGLRENPKKKTQKSLGLESMKKILFLCEECGKGFRYEKCLSNHKAGVHLSTNQRVYEESLKSLCSSFSLVRRKKKRSRVIRYKKTPLSESRSVFVPTDEELQVAECLIRLSMTSPKFVDANPETPRGSYDSDCFSSKKPRKAVEFEEPLGEDDKFDQQKQIKACEFQSEFLSDGAYKRPASFLGNKSELDQQKLKGGEFGTRLLNSEQNLMEATRKERVRFLREKNELDELKLRKASDFESMECSEMVTKSNKKNQCRLCNKIFSSYQALGGHQTSHRSSLRRRIAERNQ